MVVIVGRFVAMITPTEGRGPLAAPCLSSAFRRPEIDAASRWISLAGGLDVSNGPAPGPTRTVPAAASMLTVSGFASAPASTHLARRARANQRGDPGSPSSPLILRGERSLVMGNSIGLTAPTSMRPELSATIGMAPPASVVTRRPDVGSARRPVTRRTNGWRRTRSRSRSRRSGLCGLDVTRPPYRGAARRRRWPTLLGCVRSWSPARGRTS